MEEQFKVGNIVWTKLKGYPWWPGMVRINILFYLIIISLD